MAYEGGLAPEAVNVLDGMNSSVQKGKGIKDVHPYEVMGLDLAF